MDALNLPRPSWMTEDLVLLEEQARRFIADEFAPHIDRWHEAGCCASGFGELCRPMLTAEQG